MRRGMLLILTLVIVAAAAIAAWLWWPQPAPPQEAQGVPVEVPSGQPVFYVDTIQNVPGEGLVYRFRFVAPQIADAGADEDATHADMEWLCTGFAIPRIPTTGPQPSQIIISLSDRPVAFGEPNPEAKQFFEGYRIEDGKCIWELF